tara:strand:- start:531 stop:1427 length:897 start_codon:yes stop_codon:yes gene_type:complete
MYRFKLKEIEVGDTEIRGGKQSTVSAIDDATGRIEWDIVDAADFSSVYKALLKAKDFLSTLEKEGKAKDDVIIDGFAEDIAKLFNAFRTHVRKAYPKEYERVSRLKEAVVSDNESPSLKAKIAADDFMYQYRKALRIVASNSGNEAAEEFKNIVKLKISQLKEDEVEEQSSTATGGMALSGGDGAQYATPNAFGKNKKDVYTSQYGYKLVPKKIKGSGMIVKQLFEKTDRNEFQAKRIAAFDEVEERFNNVSKLISNAKNETAKYYNENPGSYAVVYSTDYIFELLEEIEAKLLNNPE